MLYENVQLCLRAMEGTGAPVSLADQILLKSCVRIRIKAGPMDYDSQKGCYRNT
jgi:hypothetical protein